MMTSSTKRTLKRINKTRSVSMMVIALFVFVLTVTGCSGGGLFAPADTPTPTSTATPIPTPTPAGITSDQDLSAIITAAADGDTITLAPGTFTLPIGVSIDKSLNIVGAGYEQTTITTSTPAADHPAVFWYSGTGSFSLQGLNVEYSGKDPAVIVGANSGNIELVDCSLTGATLSAEGKQMGTVNFGGDAKALIKGTRIAGKPDNAPVHEPQKIPGGIVLNTNAQVEVEGSELYDSYLGVYAFGAAVITFKDTTVRDIYYGVNLLENTSGTVQDSTFQDNTKGNITLFNDAYATISGNTFTNGSDSVGIMLTSNSEAKIENNHFSGLLGAISFADDSSGSAAFNEMESISNVNISVNGNSSVTLESNIIGSSKTGEAIGISFSGASKGEARKNTISGIYLGINLDGTSSTILEKNVITSCDTGLRYGEESTGEANENVLNFVEQGILISEPARPVLSNNVIHVYFLDLGIITDPESWIDQLTLTNNTVDEGASEVIVVTVTPKP